MDIKGVYDGKERKRAAIERRKYFNRMKIVGEYEPRFAPRLAEETVGQAYLEKEQVYAFKSKKTAGQVWNEFCAEVEKRAEELDPAFVEAVRKGGEENVERVYLPVYYHFIKKQFNAEQDYELTGKWGPYYFSPIEEEEKTVDFFKNFLPSNGKEVSGKKASSAYYDVSEERTAADLEDLQTIKDARVWVAPDFKHHPRVAEGFEITEYKILQTLLFPLWIVSVDYQGNYYHYAADVGQTRPINLPKTQAWREATEKRLNALKTAYEPFREATAVLFWMSAVLGAAALVLHFFAARTDVGKGYALPTIALYALFFLGQWLGAKKLAPQLPYLKETQFWRAELELCTLQSQSVKKYVLRFVLYLAAWLAMMALLTADVLVCLPFLFTA